MSFSGDDLFEDLFRELINKEFLEDLPGLPTEANPSPAEIVNPPQTTAANASSNLNPASLGSFIFERHETLGVAPTAIIKTKPQITKEMDGHIKTSIENMLIYLKNILRTVVEGIRQHTDQQVLLRKYKGHWIIPLHEKLFIDILNMISNHKTQLCSYYSQIGITIADDYFTSIIKIFETFKIFPMPFNLEDGNPNHILVKNSEPLVQALLITARNNYLLATQIERNATPIYNLTLVILELYQPQAINNENTPAINLNNNYFIESMNDETKTQFIQSFIKALNELLQQPQPKSLTPEIAQIIQNYQSLVCKPATSEFMAKLNNLVFNYMSKISHQDEVIWTEVAFILKTHIAKFKLVIALNNAYECANFANKLSYEPHFNCLRNLEIVINEAINKNKIDFAAKVLPITVDQFILEALHNLQNDLSFDGNEDEQLEYEREYHVVIIDASSTITAAENNITCAVFQIHVNNLQGIRLFKSLMTNIVSESESGSSLDFICNAALNNKNKISGVMIRAQQLKQLYTELKKQKNTLLLFVEHTGEAVSQKLVKKDCIDYLVSLSNLNMVKLLKFVKVHEKMNYADIQKYQAVFTAMDDNGHTKALMPISSTSKCTLYPHQNEAILKMLYVLNNGIGIGLFDDMGMGKTLEILMTIKQYNKFPVLITCPSILMKNFKNELIAKCDANGLTVVIYHGQTRKLPSNLNNCIVITSIDTLKSELKRPHKTPFKLACGYLSLDDFFSSLIEMSDDELSELITNAHTQRGIHFRKPIIEIIGDKNDDMECSSEMPKTSKKVKCNIVRLPTTKELDQITKQQDKYSKKELAKLLLSKYLWYLLTIYKVVDQYSAINDEETVQFSLDIIRSQLNLDNKEFSTYHSLKLANNKRVNGVNVIELLKTLCNSFAWKLICSDEAHHYIKRNTIRHRYMQHILWTAAYRNIPRILATGTPITNTYQDIYEIHDLLNPGSLGNRKLFLDKFNHLFKLVLNKLNSTNVMENPADVIRLINDTYIQLVHIALDLKKRSIRHQCDDPQVLANMNSSLSDIRHKKMPQRIKLPIGWQLSEQQMNVLKTSDKFTKENIDRACRVYSFIHPEKEKEADEKDAIAGLFLLRELEKLTYHPVLVSDKYKNKFYSNKKQTDDDEVALEAEELNTATKNSLEGYQSKMQLIRDIIVKEYKGDLDLFVAASGRLKAVIDRAINALNKSDHYKVLIPVSSIPFTAIIQVVLEEKIKQGVVKTKVTQPLVFIGALSESQREQNKVNFNNGNNHRVCILSAAAGGVGISLYANEVIPADSLFSPAAVNQAIARAFRLDSPHEEIVVCELKGTDPFSIKIERLLKNKSEWIEFLVNKGEKNIHWFVGQLRNYCLTNPDYNSSAEKENFYNKLFDFIQKQLIISIALPIEQQNNVQLPSVTSAPIQVLVPKEPEFPVIETVQTALPAMNDSDNQNWDTTQLKGKAVAVCGDNDDKCIKETPIKLHQVPGTFAYESAKSEKKRQLPADKDESSEDKVTSKFKIGPPI